MWTAGISAYEYSSFLMRLYHSVVGENSCWRPEHECVHNAVYDEDGENKEEEEVVVVVKEEEDQPPTSGRPSYRAAAASSVKASQETRSSATMIQAMVRSRKGKRAVAARQQGVLRVQAGVRGRQVRKARRAQPKAQPKVQPRPPRVAKQRPAPKAPKAPKAPPIRPQRIRKVRPAPNRGLVHRPPPRPPSHGRTCGAATLRQFQTPAGEAKCDGRPGRFGVLSTDAVWSRPELVSQRLTVPASWLPTLWVAMPFVPPYAAPTPPTPRPPPPLCPRAYGLGLRPAHRVPGKSNENWLPAAAEHAPRIMSWGVNTRFDLLV